MDVSEDSQFGSTSSDSRPNIVDNSPGLPYSSSPNSTFLSSKPRARKWILGISRFGLVALFLFTAGAKLAIIEAFATNVGQLLSASGIDHNLWAWPATITVIAAELLTAALLVWRRTVRPGSLCAAALLMSFAGYALYYVYALRGEPLECGCFGGIIGSQLGVKTALRNLILLVPAVIVWFGYRSPQTWPRRRLSQNMLRRDYVVTKES